MYYIYRITNRINGKTYIGQHKYKKLNDSYMGSGKLIRRAQKKYGMENFEKEILYSRIQYKETADDMERFAITKERALGKAEYNIADGGQGGNLGDEVNKKISEAKKGHKVSEETKKKISEANKGTSGYWCGKHLSEEARRKMSEAKKGKKLGTHWYNNGEINVKAKECPEGFVKGRHFSEEWRRKISEAIKGKHWKLVDGKQVWY